MNRKFRLLLVLVIVGIVAYTLFDSVKPAATPADYHRTELERRRDKDAAFRESKTSPVRDRTAFTGLRYYEPDPAWRVPATLERLGTGKPYRIQMSGGETETYEPYGRASFTLDGQRCTLLVFRSQEDGQLFIPFKDLTNGSETYGAGRYLDVPENEVTNDGLPLDFNHAYNPFCAYNPTYTCPIPPSENHLKMAVRAGERVAEAH
jgi:uncharacterized protein (DUF1684 family)